VGGLEKENEPVASDAYDDAWLASAWGKKANEQLLSTEHIRPRPRLQRALQLGQFRPGQTLLDIASGRGELLALASERGVYAIGVDYSAAALNFAQELKDRRRTKILPGGAMQLVRGDACRLPFDSNSFDRITMLDIIEHLVPVQLETMLREVHRLLKPGGYAVLHTLPNRWVYDITFPTLHRLYPKFAKNPRSEFEKEIHVNEQDLPALSRLLAKCGFTHRLWLEQHMPAQARWNQSNDEYGDQRDRLYPILAGRTGTLLEWLSKTPLKLLLSNDIFGIAAKDELPREADPPLALTERAICWLFST
jgi:ubiquinone/menaquinone biosynthesis C-methylase UbiE